MTILSRRLDQAYVTATATYRGETRDLGVFNGFDGGGATADSSKIRRGWTWARATRASFRSSSAATRQLASQSTWSLGGEHDQPAVE
jgi:hypothetical protein